ncbi:MAG: reverse transcriptase domain-containing protein [Candidatus Methanomethylophilaceae archaeon]
MLFVYYSFGFRPGRSAHDAIMRVVELYDEGYTVAVSIDLRHYFDTIPQDLLMTLIRKTIRDLRFTELIKRFLKSGVAMPDGLLVRTEEGAPQGGPLSPLLANIYLDQFDKELERRGLHFVRYADDAQIYVKSERSAKRVMESCTEYLEKRLKLTVNREKSSIGSPMELKYLGFKLVRMSDGSTWVMPHEKSIERFKQRTNEITRRHRGVKVDVVITELRRYVRGWFAYFGIGPNCSYFDDLDGHLRRRIRAFLLTQWKTPRNIQRQLKRIGNVSYESVSWDRIKSVSYKKHKWRVSKSPIMHRILNNANLQAETGMYYMTDDWTKVQARFSRSPLRNRTVGSVGGRQTSLSEYA